MKKISHITAKPTHYNKAATHYDAFNEKNSRSTNRIIEKLLKKYRVKTVLDMTCGTGSQVLWLAKHGYTITGSDFNLKMLKVAKDKAKKENLKVKFIKGDMRNIKVGQFDAVITIFNAIGHLTKKDFEKAIQNVDKNLNEGGIYVFDIFNLNYLLKKNQITQLTIDWFINIGNTKIRDIQYSTIDKDGTLASYTISYVQKGSNKPKITKNTQTLQIYTVKQLKEMLYKNGFKVLKQCAIDGSKFNENKTERILMVAKKQ